MCARVAMATEAEGACAGKRVLHSGADREGVGGFGRVVKRDERGAWAGRRKQSAQR